MSDTTTHIADLVSAANRLMHAADGKFLEKTETAVNAKKLDGFTLDEVVNAGGGGGSIPSVIDCGEI